MSERRSTTANRFSTDAPGRRERDLVGKYRPLYEYLNGRFADTVVLTFAEMEDLLGFKLPDQARTQREWWTGTGTSTTEPGYSDAWTLTKRTPTPNLLARNVVFERRTS